METRSSQKSIDMFEEVEVPPRLLPVASVKSEPPEPTDEPKVKSVNLKHYGELTVASFYSRYVHVNKCSY